MNICEWLTGLRASIEQHIFFAAWRAKLRVLSETFFSYQKVASAIKNSLLTSKSAICKSKCAFSYQKCHLQSKDAFSYQKVPSAIKSAYSYQKDPSHSKRFLLLWNSQRADWLVAKHLMILACFRSSDRTWIACLLISMKRA